VLHHYASHLSGGPKKRFLRSCRRRVAKKDYVYVNRFHSLTSCADASSVSDADEDGDADERARQQHGDKRE